MHRHPELQTQVTLLSQSILAMTGVKPKHAGVLELAAQLNGFGSWRQAKAATQAPKPKKAAAAQRQRSVTEMREARDTRDTWLNNLQPGDVVCVAHTWHDREVEGGFRSNAVVVKARDDWFQVRYCHGARVDVHSTGLYRSSGSTSYETVEPVGLSVHHNWSAGYFFEDCAPKRRDGKSFRPTTRTFEDPVAQTLYEAMKLEARLSGALRFDHRCDKFEQTWSLTFTLGKHEQSLDFFSEAERDAAWAGLLDGIVENVWNQQWPQQAVATNQTAKLRRNPEPLPEGTRTELLEALQEGIRVRQRFDGLFDYHFVAAGKSARSEIPAIRSSSDTFNSAQAALEAAREQLGDTTAETLSFHVEFRLDSQWKGKIVDLRSMLKHISLDVAYCGVGVALGKPDSIKSFKLEVFPGCLMVNATLELPFNRWAPGAVAAKDIHVVVVEPSYGHADVTKSNVKCVPQDN